MITFKKAKTKAWYLPGLSLLLFIYSSICYVHHLLTLRLLLRRMNVTLRHRRHLMDGILHLRLKDGSHRHHLKGGNLLMTDSMEFSESFVHVARREPGSFAGHSDSEFRALYYLPVTRFCFVVVASYC